MTIEVKVPTVGESVTEVTIEQWLKREGEAIERDKGCLRIAGHQFVLRVPGAAFGVRARRLIYRSD